MSTRRLAAILVADVVGYARLVGADETGTLARLQTLRRDVIEPQVAAHGGRLFKAVGDGFLVEFASAVQAVTAALAIQRQGDAALPLRIGIHLGDVVVQGDDLMGDGVNIAARIEGVADPGSVAISRQIHDQVRDRLDASFVDKGEIELKNLARPVHVFAVSDSKRREAGADTTAGTALPLPDKPSIAVLPFQNMSGDPEQEYFADGIVEDIITALSRFRSLFVIARNSSFSYKGKSPDIRQVGRELGVRYVLEGSVRKAAGRLRITGQLIDSETGAHLWADRFDGSLEDVFELQDHVTTCVVGAIEPRLRRVEIEQARRRRPDNLDAHACVMRAMPAVWSFDLQERAEALRHLERAIALDPNYALAQALAAWCHAQSAAYHGTGELNRERSLAVQLAESAAHLDSDDAIVLTVLAATYSLAKDHARAEPLIEKALLLNPNSAWTWQRSGWLNHYLERYELAIEHFNRSIRTSPLDPLNFNAFLGIGASYLGLEKFAEAVTWLKKGISMQPGAVFAYRILAPALVHLGRLDEARQAVRQYLQAYPEMTISTALLAIPTTSPAYSRLLSEGLRKAGLPE